MTTFEDLKNIVDELKELGGHPVYIKNNNQPSSVDKSSYLSEEEQIELDRQVDAEIEKIALDGGL